MNQAPEFGFPFSPFICRLVTEWRENAVVIGQNIFRPLSTEEVQAANLPPIKGSSSNDIGWMLDADGNPMVAKGNGHFRGETGWYGTTPREKVAADLAPLGLAVAPVLIWEKPLPKGSSTYYSVSPRIFPDSQDTPSDTMLIADFFLAKLSVFDQWIYNMDRHKGQIVYGTPVANADTNKAGIDHGLSNYDAPDATLTLLDNPIGRNSETHHSSMGQRSCTRTNRTPHPK